MNCIFCQQPANFICSCGRMVCQTHTGQGDGKKLVCSFCAEQSLVRQQQLAEQNRQFQEKERIRLAQAAEVAAQQAAQAEERRQEEARRAEEAAENLRFYGRDEDETCSKCWGEGKVEGFLNLGTKECPQCHGSGTISKHYSYDELVEREKRETESTNEAYQNKSGPEDHHWGDY